MDVKAYVDNIITKAIDKGASDIHWEAQANQYVIRFRIDGLLITEERGALDEFPAISSRIKILSNLDIAEKRLAQDGRMNFIYGQREIDIRVSTISTVHGEKIVLRILDPIAFEENISDLGLSKEELEEFDNIRKQNDGIILLTGPTGCGKSTSLYALLQKENREEINITTIEDPVEYLIDGINQVQVNERAGIHFDNTLRAVLRQDPDILLIGEIRDNETANIASRAAITGHKVYGTLHTTDTYSAIIRLLDMGVADYLIKASVRTIISQRLVKRLCSCKKEVDLPEEDRLLFESRNISCQKIYEPVGCDKCNGGYKGRMAVMEILHLDQNMVSEISQHIDVSALREIGYQKGVKTIFERALERVAQGQTSLSEALLCQINL